MLYRDFSNTAADAMRQNQMRRPWKQHPTPRRGHGSREFLKVACFFRAPKIELWGIGQNHDAVLFTPAGIGIVGECWIFINIHPKKRPT